MKTEERIDKQIENLCNLVDKLIKVDAINSVDEISKATIALAELISASSKLCTNERPLEELCKPLIEYIKENYNPHTEVVVTMDGITVKQDIEGLPEKTRRINE